MKSVYIAEKPSVARAFAAALKFRMSNRDGYMESEEAIVTWCVGHLVTMSYPDAYDARYKRWSLETIPFLPEEFKYEVIEGVKKQFNIVSSLLNREDVDTIYICTDSGREGEYIYRLVDQQAGVTGKMKKRVWIDSQTEEEIVRGVREAKDDAEYDGLGAAAYLRAKEDYLMGINFSRALTLKYGYSIKDYLGIDKCVISIGRVMTCVLGIVVDREREIRAFTKTPFYRVMAGLKIADGEARAEWRAVEGSAYYQSPKLYKENGFKERKDAEGLIRSLTGESAGTGTADSLRTMSQCTRPPDSPALVEKIEKKKETKNAPLLYNLAELQNDCSKFFKITPEATLNIAQELYEKKLTTYPRTDARVLSTAIAKEIKKNIEGLTAYEPCAIYAKSILQHEAYKDIAKSRYVNDKAITDHYAIIPTGQGLSALNSLNPTAQKVYECIVRRFLAVFFPPAQYQKIALTLAVKPADETLGDVELFFASFKIQTAKGYTHVMEYSFLKKKAEAGSGAEKAAADENEAEDAAQDKGDEEREEFVTSEAFFEAVAALKKGSEIPVSEFYIKEGETSPPKRYSSGTLILTMENAGQFIEDEELRAQIKGSGIGTSATRAGILDKLVKNNYLAINKKTQIVTPTQMGEMIYETVLLSMKPMLNPALTASWEKGLTMVASGELTEDDYMVKLDDFIRRRTDAAKQTDFRGVLRQRFDEVARFYPVKEGKKAASEKKQTRKRKAKKEEKN